MAIGQSGDRTPGKHSLLATLLGRLTGAFPYVKFLKKPFFIIDLCAGDGQPSFHSGQSSPQIIHKYASLLRQKMGNDAVVVILIEKDRATFDKLQTAFPADEHTYLIHGDSKDPSVISRVQEIIKERGNKRSPCFLHNDPNKIVDFAITKALLQILPPFTTSLSTMGCNVAGIKRLPLEARLLWFECIYAFVSFINQMPCHDAYLSTLRKDKSQWAYLITTPAKWRDQTARDVTRAFHSWPFGIDGSWLSSRDQFDLLIRRLFLTKKEWEDDQNVA